MTMNKDIKTFASVIAVAPADLVLGAVAAGMKRYVTFIKVTNEHAGANAIFLCSGASALHAVSGVAKDKQFLANQYDAFAYPDSPRPDNPLFSIAANKFLAAFTSAGNMHLFLQYYDE